MNTGHNRTLAGIIHVGRTEVAKLPERRKRDFGMPERRCAWSGLLHFQSRHVVDRLYEMQRQ
jgi:hypothetical protein